MADDVPLSLFPAGGLYLKNVALITIEVRLPEIRNPGVTVSNWEIMEKIKEKSQPEEYQYLRVTLSTRELIRFEGEFDSLRALRKAVLLLNGKTIKLRGFPDPLQMRAIQTETPYPMKHQWEQHFVDRGVDNFDEGRPGERPDTVHIKGLPIRWFTSKKSNGKPCPKVLTQAFEKFGKVRQVGFYDSSTESSQTGFSSFGPGTATQVLNFEAYLQYEKYTGFCNAMEGLKNVQLIRLQAGGQAVAKIKIDFDRTGFLSDRAIRKRLHMEEKQRQERETEERRREESQKEEEKKKTEELKAKEKEKEERKLKKLEEKKERKRQQAILVANLREVAIQRRAEAQRLMSVLLARAAESKCQEEMKERERQAKVEKEREKMKKLKEEAELRDQLIQNVQLLEQRKLALQRELKMRTIEKGSSDVPPIKKKKKTK